jgi:hypothetical protein
MSRSSSKVICSSFGRRTFRSDQCALSLGCATSNLVTRGYTHTNIIHVDSPSCIADRVQTNWPEPNCCTTRNPKTSEWNTNISFRRYRRNHWIKRFRFAWLFLPYDTSSTKSVCAVSSSKIMLLLWLRNNYCLPCHLPVFPNRPRNRMAWQTEVLAQPKQFVRKWYCQNDLVEDAATLLKDVS